VSDLPGYLTVEEYAGREGLHPETIKRRLRAGRLKGVKMPGRIWLIPEPGQTVRVCMGCANKPIGNAPAGYDDDGNLWHMACSSALLARYARLIKKNGNPMAGGHARRTPEREGHTLQHEPRSEKTPS